eukprot:jgi/Hompol1/5046/HPOL_000737-RA
MSITAASQPVTIQLAEGIRGGFMPAKLRRRINIDWHGSGKPVTITKYVLSDASDATDGYLELQSGPLSELSITQQVHAFVDEALAAFQTLPKEDPIGGEDVYRLDTSILIQTRGFSWQNSANQGCDIRASKVHPSDEQRQLFKSFAARINQLADSHATSVVGQSQ